MRIIKAKDYDEMSKKAANIIAAQITLKPDTVLGLATGSTPLGTYKNLIEKYENGELDFSEVTTVNLDEYKGLPRSDNQSYYYFMYDNLFNHINVKKENTYVPDGVCADDKTECEKYEKIIEQKGGIDLQLLGIGHNGHIGFNEPAEEFSVETHCVDLQTSTIEANKRFFNSADEVPRKAFTMGIGTIMKAKKILMIINGSDKAKIAKAALKGSVSPAVPASVIQMHPDVTVICDADAYAELER